MTRFRSRRRYALCALAFAAPLKQSALAATATTSFNVTVTITAQCAVSSATNLTFPATGLLNSAVNGSSSFAVLCTNTTPYTIGLDTGLNGLSGQRRMKGGASNNEFISYNLYSDAARTSAWGNSAPSWVSGVGSGSTTTYTVYGQAPIQTTPSAAANYTDTVTVTVTY